MTTRRRTMVRLGLALVVLVWYYVAEQRSSTPSTDTGSAPGAIEEAYASRSSGVWVQASGVVDRLLEDDTHGARHQRFIVRLDSGHTVLVSHNLDLAARVEPLQPGDAISLRGEYEWNERGGIVHWTHHDPGGKREGGWIRSDDQVFR